MSGRWMQQSASIRRSPGCARCGRGGSSRRRPRSRRPAPPRRVPAFRANTASTASAEAHARARSGWHREGGGRPGGTALGAGPRKAHPSCRLRSVKGTLIKAVGCGLPPERVTVRGARDDAGGRPIERIPVPPPSVDLLACHRPGRASVCRCVGLQGSGLQSVAPHGRSRLEPAAVDPRMTPGQIRIVRNRALH